MRFMILVKASAASEAGARPGDALVAAMGRYHAQLMRAGVLLDANGLQPSSEGWRIRHAQGQAKLEAGPFDESQGLVAGYVVIQVRSREEALEWSRRFPAPSGPDAPGEIEVRPLHELDAFAAAESLDRSDALDASPR